MSSVRSDSLVLLVLVAGLVLFIIAPWTLSYGDSQSVSQSPLKIVASFSISIIIIIISVCFYSIDQSICSFFPVCFTIYLDIAAAAAAAASIDWQSKVEILGVAFVCVWFRCEHKCEHSFTTSFSLVLLRLPRDLSYLKSLESRL